MNARVSLFHTLAQIVVRCILMLVIAFFIFKRNDRCLNLIVFYFENEDLHMYVITNGKRIDIGKSDKRGNSYLAPYQNVLCHVSKVQFCH